MTVILKQPPKTGLIAWYSFNGDLKDYSDNFLDGTAIRGTFEYLGLDAKPIFAQDKFYNNNSAISFFSALDNAGFYNDVCSKINNNVLLNPTTTICFSFWAKLDITKMHQVNRYFNYVITKGNGWSDPDSCYAVQFADYKYIDNSGIHIEIFCSGGSPYYGAIRGIKNAVVDNKWHHYIVAATSGDTNAIFYIDGILQTSIQNSQGAPNISFQSKTNNVYIGASHNPSANQCNPSGDLYLDELLIHNRVLTQVEIDTLYNNLSSIEPLILTETTTDDTLSEYYQNLLIMQYHEMPDAKGMIDSFSKEIIAGQLITKIRDAFNLDTAVGKQLETLGKYIGVQRVVNGLDLNKIYFQMPNYGDPDPGHGFALYYTNPTVFFKLYNAGSSYSMTDDELRQLIKLKIRQHKSNHSMSDIDDILLEFFGVGCVATDNGDMTITYAFSVSNNLAKIAVFTNALPKPSGVALIIVGL